jgi:DNA-binding transcriptional MerR regulator
MDKFSISQLALFSGIKPHTIRIWEQRYQVLTPNRSAGNTRFYNNNQLRRLLNIVSLAEAGHRVSELSVMTDKELFTLIDQTYSSPQTDSTGYYVSQLIEAATRYDEHHFTYIFSHCLLTYGMRDTYIRVIYPLLQRIGVMWKSDTMPPGYEHFITNLLRQKLFTAIDALPPSSTDAETWLLFLPENELHEIGLLFAHYLLRQSGRRSIYLGPNVPMASVVAAASLEKPEKALLFFVHRLMPEDAQTYLANLQKSLPLQKIYLAGDPDLLSRLKIKGKIERLTSLAMFLEQTSL